MRRLDPEERKRRDNARCRAYRLRRTLAGLPQPGNLEARKIRDRERARLWRVANPELNKRLQEAWWQRVGKARVEALREEALIRYGGCCQCCGEMWRPALTIDHMDGDGAAHRRATSLGGRSGGIFRWLKDQGWPTNFRLLCWTCNRMAFVFGGECPCPRGQLHRLRMTRGLA